MPKGMAILTVSASLPGQSSPPQTLTFFLGLYMIAFGAGGIKPCVSSFGADQFDDTDPLERPKKGSFFNWFYFSINIGSLISGTILVYIQDNYGWGLGFSIPTLFMALAIGSFFVGSGIYRFQKPGGSPIVRVCQVIVAAFRKWRFQLPVDESLLYEVPGKHSTIEGSRKLDHTNEMRYLNSCICAICLNKL
jgi:solute carrier family 15 (peptide/histidine transporter), member 3/4